MEREREGGQSIGEEEKARRQRSWHHKRVVVHGQGTDCERSFLVEWIDVGHAAEHGNVLEHGRLERGWSRAGWRGRI